MARRSKRKSVQRLPKDKRHSARKPVRVKLDRQTLSHMIVSRSPILPRLPNTQDDLVVHSLSTTPIGELPVDHFAKLLCKKAESASDKQVLDLRLALIRIYFRAAYRRIFARATNAQIASARKASNCLQKAIGHLDDINPSRQRGLQGVFGSPFDDRKGLDEHNEFSSASMQIKLDIVPIVMKLDRMIEIETRKPVARGERKKRLRTLVDTLAEWWTATTGKSLAPYVQAKRLGRHSVVIGRRGGFADLARSVFSEIDEFGQWEVISAVTNVHESGLAKQQKQKIGVPAADPRVVPDRGPSWVSD